MFRFAKWVVPSVVLAIVLGVAGFARAEDKDSKGTVAGTVKNADGSAAAGVQVRLMHAFDRAERKAAKSEVENKSDTENKDKKSDKPVPVSSAVTGNDGAFSLSDIPAGKYVLQAKMKRGGMAREEIEVKSGETTKLELTLADKKAGKSEEKHEEKPQEKHEEK